MADHRHKRDTDARRKPRAALVAGSLALLATATAVTVGVLAGNPEPTPIAEDSVAADGAAGATADLGSAVDHLRPPVSRSGSRLAAEKQRQERALDERRAATSRAVQRAHQRLWTTTALNLWSNPGEDATQVGLLAAGKQVLVTGRRTAERV